MTDPAERYRREQETLLQEMDDNNRRLEGNLTPDEMTEVIKRQGFDPKKWATLRKKFHKMAKQAWKMTDEEADGFVARMDKQMALGEITKKPSSEG